MSALLDQSVALVRDANTLLSAGQHKQASLKYQESLSLQPENAVALHNLAALQMGADSRPQRISGLYLCHAAATLLGSDQYMADYAMALTHLGMGKTALRYLHKMRNSFQQKEALDRLLSSIASTLGLTKTSLRAVLNRPISTTRPLISSACL